MIKWTTAEIDSYVIGQGWTGTYPMFNDYDNNWGNAETLEEGYHNFCVERGAMFNSIKAEFQSKHSAMSQRGAEAYANNWN